MRLNKIIMSALIAMSIGFVGCGQTANTNNNTQGNTKIENKQSKENKENNSDLKYAVVKEVLEVNDKNIKIAYPLIKDFPGELLMDYMNQSLKKIPDVYATKDSYTDVNLDYEITKMDNDILSVLFTGTGKVKALGEITIKQSVNLDLSSSNEITFNNLIKDDEESKNAVIKMINKKAEAEGLQKFEGEGMRVYFKEDNIVFMYIPSDDSSKKFIELSIPAKELDKYLNTDFGEAPAS